MPTDIQKQIERRRQRALEEIAKVRNKGNHPVFSLFEVTSTSGRAYHVEIRSLAELHNTCTCPDYKTNLIGTCKHIEGVLLYLKKEQGDRLETLARKRPAGTQIYLHYGVDITVRVGQPIPKNPAVRELLNRNFDPTGVLIGAPLQSLPRLLADLESLPPRERSLVRVDQAVREHLDLLQDREAVEQQKAWFVDQVQRGNRSLGVLSTRLYPYQEEGAMHLAFGRRAMLADDMGLGKCVGRDTPLFVNGALHRAEEVWEQFAGPSVFDGEGEWAEPCEPLWTNALTFGEQTEQIVPARIARLYRQHVAEPMRLIRLSDGSQIVITRRHELLARDRWDNQLEVGDIVCVPARLNWDGPEADPNLVTLLAWQIAEGYELAERGTVRIYQKDVARLEMLRRAAQRFGEKSGIPMNSLGISQPAGRVAYLTIVSRAYQRFLQVRGYPWGQKSAGKRVPDLIMSSGIETARAFLREYFSAEGSVSTTMRLVEISSASEWLMQQLSCLLRRFGIWLRITVKQKRATNGSGILRTYYIGTLGGNAARLFLSEIGFADDAKQHKLEVICATPANTNVEGIPASDLLTGMADTAGLPYRHFGVGPVYFAGSQELSRPSAHAVIDALDRILTGEAEADYRRLPTSKWTVSTLAAYAALDHDALQGTRDHLSRLIEREVFYCRIVEIRDVEYGGWVYDFEVEGRHNFVAGGLLCHNTVQAITASALLKELRGIERALVICPASLKHQWAREIRRFTSLPVTVVEGGLNARRDLYREPSFFKIINYEIVRRDLKDLDQLRPDLIVLDEAQRIKNWRAKTAAMVKQLRSRYAFVLTGTPLENRLDELYSIFQFLDPRILGPLWQFNDRFFELEERPGGTFKVLGYKNLDELRTTIAPYVMRRVREEVLKDLPERVDNNFFVEMTDPQWKAYDEFKESVAKLVAKAQRRPLTPKEREILLMCLIKMRLICNALALHDKAIPVKDRERTAPKLTELGEILADQIASNGHKAIVFSQWADMLALTEPVIRRVGVDYVKLTGAVPSPKRGALVERFFEDRDCRVFLSTDAGGVGLNLQAASLVVNLDLPWNPAVLAQRIARAHRHGQPHSVHVINLVAKDTIEERMLDTLAAKRSVFAGVFGAEEAPAAIRFEDTGQSLLKEIDAMLKKPVEVELALAPAAPEMVEEAIEVVAPKPTLEGFADRLLARLPGRVLLVRKAPVGEGVLVVVADAPAELRPVVESMLSEYFTPDVPALHLMEQEGYRALAAFLPALPAAP
ncbi:MAG TPA: SNF2-related protein, partial [Anaerolineae bacterium]|nr:SNF2-related protein [Anaerolineae bacterium]